MDRREDAIAVMASTSCDLHRRRAFLSFDLLVLFLAESLVSMECDAAALATRARQRRDVVSLENSGRIVCASVFSKACECEKGGGRQGGTYMIP